MINPLTMDGLNVEILQEVLSWADVTQVKHFDKWAYKRGKRIFLTMDAQSELWCVKLDVGEQDLFGCFNREVIYPVPNKWGAHGWTFLEYKKMPEETLRDILLSAWKMAR